MLHGNAIKSHFSPVPFYSYSLKPERKKYLGVIGNELRSSYTASDCSVTGWTQIVVDTLSEVTRKEVVFQAQVHLTMRQTHANVNMFLPRLEPLTLTTPAQLLPRLLNFTTHHKSM